MKTKNNKQNEEINDGDKVNGIVDINGRNKNLSSIKKLAKSKKSNLARFKKSDLKKSDFVKANIFGTDFFILKAKKHFTQLQKTFIKTLIFH